jgi:hypothetical protein
LRDTRQEIIHFWFEETEPRLWFQRSDEFDSIIKDRFAMTYNMAKDGLCNGWNVDADGCLALCLLLDQFPRRMFRGTAAEFETDERALLIAKQAISKASTRCLRPKSAFSFISRSNTASASRTRKRISSFLNPCRKKIQWPISLPSNATRLSKNMAATRNEMPHWAGKTHPRKKPIWWRRTLSDIIWLRGANHARSSADP